LASFPYNRGFPTFLVTFSPKGTTAIAQIDIVYINCFIHEVSVTINGHLICERVWYYFRISGLGIVGICCISVLLVVLIPVVVLFDWDVVRILKGFCEVALKMKPARR
jgi:hypothetical protein